ncbi:flavin reductase family protein [Wielerella bovis]|uniref:flavin reductase family protein n=1 Tax=Wielerella bovis TaxID=2917790 RepID=UPI00201966FE|nr:flavin reductase family protein [Wielerella bovis]ULJ60085.1 flavin reductase family protein [Wielerella bovis]
MNISPVPLNKAFRLLNHGPTVLVSAHHDGVDNIMAAAWSSPLDFSPCRVTVVLDKSTFTRSLIEQSGYFALQIPVQSQARLVLEMGNSRHKNPEKIQNVEIFRQTGFDVPLVSGCAAWLACKVLPEPHNQQTYDLFIGEVQGAWSDDRVFCDGHWLFDTAPAEMRTLHYVSGGQFYEIGAGLDLGDRR